MSTSEIAIFSTSIDEPTFGPIARKLEAYGHKTWVYQADKVTSGEDDLLVTIEDDELVVTYNGIVRELSSIHSAWFRHPDILNLNLNDKARQLCIEREVSALQESIWQQIPDEAWLNHPARMDVLQAKIAQLALARRVGFKTPTTLVSNRWDAIERVFDESEIVAKMSRGLMYINNRAHVVYATPLTKATRTSLWQDNPFPGIYQERLAKQREWRITIVGDEAFQAAIYTSEDAKDDWRRHQLSSNVRFAAESMPRDEVIKCYDFLKQSGLVYGAFDFVEDYEGRITFLECNVNGQYRWLEDILNLPISDAIVSKLIENLKRNMRS